MILSSALSAYVCTEVVDMRKSIDALAQLVQMSMGMDALSGHVYVFIGRRRNKVKLLVWDRQGFWVLYKRLERGRFPDPAGLVGGGGVGLGELIAWLDGIDLRRATRLPAVDVRRVA